MKSNIKFIFGFIIGGIVFSSITAYAAMQYQASQIAYKNKTVEQALDELYNGGNTISAVEKEIKDSATINLNEGEKLVSRNTKIATVSGSNVTILDDGNVNIDVVKNDNIVKRYIVEALFTPISFLSFGGTVSSYNAQIKKDQLPIVLSRLQDGIKDSKQGGYGTMLFANNQYVIFEVKKDTYISFKSNNYSDSGGSTNKTAQFYTLDDSDNKTLYYELQMDIKTDKYGKKLFKKGKYYLTCTGMYCEFEEWYFGKDA